MVYPRQTWRLLVTPPARGAWNMALDEALLETTGQRQSRPCLRLYAWEPPCLSLGYAQPAADLDHARLEALGWDWVRRPTGGRAILHTDELTYSVVAPLSEPRVAGGVLESYQRLSNALLAALHSLGISASAHPLAKMQATPANGPVCFEVPSNYEIVVNGKKLVGSAQARRKDGLLQHGSLPLWGDLTRITRGLCFADEAAREQAGMRLLAHATTVEAVLGCRVEWQTAANAFIEGFQGELNLELQPDEPSISELQRTSELVETKYSHAAWLGKI